MAKLRIEMLDKSLSISLLCLARKKPLIHPRLLEGKLRLLSLGCII